MPPLALACVVLATVVVATTGPLPAATAARQTPQPPPASMLAGAPLGFTSQLEPSITVKLAGFVAGEPPNWPAGLPQPDFAGFARAIAPRDWRIPVPILAMSLGIDVLSIGEVRLKDTEFPDEPAPLGVEASYPLLKVGDHGWYAILFSVDEDQLGPSPDLAPDLVAAAAAAKLDRSVFCYVLPESSGARLQGEDESRLVLGPEALGLSAERDEQVVALNTHMALYTTDLGRYPDLFTTRPLPEQPSIYFTVDTTRLPEAERQQLAEAWEQDAVAPNTIYQSQWNGTAWRPVRVYATAAQLRLGVPPDVAIDGLALDTKKQGSSRREHELLFSLRSTTNHVVEAAQQIQFVRVEASAPDDPPRPVVVRRRDNGYGSLARQVRGGRGIGDFCTQDPWVVDDGRNDWRLADPLLDDFFVARRLPPPDAHLLPTERGLRFVGLLPATSSTQFGWLPEREPPAHESERPIVLVRGPFGRMLLPELRLGIAAYRHHGPAGPMVRACLSGPLPTPVAGAARVRWGRLANYTEPTDAPGNLRWLDERPVTYTGTPVAEDIALPTDGVLPPRTGTPGPAGSSSAAAAALPDGSNRGAFVVQWQLEADGRTYVSPLAALRF